MPVISAEPEMQYWKPETDIWYTVSLGRLLGKHDEFDCTPLKDKAPIYEVLDTKTEKLYKWTISGTQHFKTLVLAAKAVGGKGEGLEPLKALQDVKVKVRRVGKGPDARWEVDIPDDTAAQERL